MIYENIVKKVWYINSGMQTTIAKFEAETASKNKSRL
jgi:hypothetical protein